MFLTNGNVIISLCTMFLKQQIFYDEIVKQVRDFERDITFTNDFLSEDISFDENEKCVKRLKNGKALGYDGIPNELLRNHNVQLAL